MDARPPGGDEPSEQPVTPAREAPAGPRPRVLVADDNADMRSYLTGILSPSFEVETVEDGLRR